MVNFDQSVEQRAAARTGIDCDTIASARAQHVGVIASLLGVAGGEFLIPTLVLLFGADIKLAGSLSLAGAR